MRKLSGLLVLVMLLVVTNLTLAGPKNAVNNNVEETLLVGLNSENLGLKTSSAYFLGEYGTSKSVIPLMKVLKSGKTEEERISAAVALSKINSDVARFAIKQRAKFDESERVRKQCALCYQESSLTK
ncbi:MAG: hypothetical protein H6609_04530 [Ignavibacteriales bacterium]|nr:hypothetical protein [Ignavibacteriales bacterium]